MRPAIELPAGFRLFRTERFFLAIANSADSVCTDSQPFQLIAHRIRTVVAQAQVVVLGAPFIAMTGNQ